MRTTVCRRWPQDEIRMNDYLQAADGDHPFRCVNWNTVTVHPLGIVLVTTLV